MTTMASQITSLTIVYSTVYSGADQRKHESSASLAFVWEIHRGLVNSPHKWLVTRKMFPFDDVIMHNPNYAREWHGNTKSHTELIMIFAHFVTQYVFQCLYGNRCFVHYIKGIHCSWFPLCRLLNALIENMHLIICQQCWRNSIYCHCIKPSCYNAAHILPTPHTP